MKSPRASGVSRAATLKTSRAPTRNIWSTRKRRLLRNLRKVFVRHSERSEESLFGLYAETRGIPRHAACLGMTTFHPLVTLLFHITDRIDLVLLIDTTDAAGR